LEDLSLHILDIAENSVRAGANLVQININEDVEEDLLVIEIEDNGRGMNSDELQRAKDPFFTTKNNKKVGLGLSLFSEAARMANGNLEIKTEEKRGTMVRATFQYSHIDRKPLGNIRATLEILIVGYPKADFLYKHIKGENVLSLDTRKMRVGNGKDSSLLSGKIKRIRQILNNEQ